MNQIPGGFQLEKECASPRHPTQPDVYCFASYLAKRFQCGHLLTIGQPATEELSQIHPGFEIVGIVPSNFLNFYRDQYPFAEWWAADLEGRIDEGTLRRTTVVCVGVIDQMPDPVPLLRRLKNWLEYAPVCILTSGDRDLNGGNCEPGSEYPGPRARWNLKELESLLEQTGLNVEFIGWTGKDDHDYEKKTVVAVITKNAIGKLRSNTPSDFKVVAFMAAYNEEDIIVHSIRKWTEQGIHVHILENWSTDGTYDLARELEGRLPVTVERFPKEGPTGQFEWGAILKRIEVLTKEIESDWFVRRGVDEVLTSPWPGVSYRDGLYLVDQAGFNCVDHTVIEFNPVDEGFEAGSDHEAYFKRFVFPKHPAYFMQRKAWKNCGRPIVSVNSGGHIVDFEGARVYPFKFLLKHYPFRSQKHGEKKVFRERKTRWNPDERAKGWHDHYDLVEAGHQFLRPVPDQEYFDEDDFNKTYLIERLSGIGIIK
jgi:hypothetical protein